MSGPPIQSINIFSLRFGLWVRNSYYLLLYLDTSLKLIIPFFSGAMPVCILEQSTAARRNVVTATTLDQRRSLRANSLALLCQLLNFDFICAVEVFLAINNLQTIVIVLFNQTQSSTLSGISRRPITIVLEIWGSQPLNALPLYYQDLSTVYSTF